VYSILGAPYSPPTFDWSHPDTLYEYQHKSVEEVKRSKSRKFGELDIPPYSAM
jgi:hypothetical protein